MKKAIKFRNKILLFVTIATITFILYTIAFLYYSYMNSDMIFIILYLINAITVIIGYAILQKANLTVTRWKRYEKYNLGGMPPKDIDTPELFDEAQIYYDHWPYEDNK